MTEPTAGQEKDEVTFTPEQQAFLDKKFGKIRIETREKATADAKAKQEAATADAERKELAASAEFEKLAKMHADRVTELEPYEAEAAAYRELITGMLKDKVKTLGDTAKKFVAALPESMSDLDKLNALNAVEESFETDARKVPGTPAAKLKKAASKKERPEGHRRMRL